jgi:hypothetical protein
VGLLSPFKLASTRRPCREQILTPLTVQGRVSMTALADDPSRRKVVYLPLAQKSSPMGFCGIVVAVELTKRLVQLHVQSVVYPSPGELRSVIVPISAS